MAQPVTQPGVPWAVAVPWLLLLALGGVGTVWLLSTPRSPVAVIPEPESPAVTVDRPPRPRILLDESGWTEAIKRVQPWSDPTSLTMARDAWDRVGYRGIGIMDHHLIHDDLDPAERFKLMMTKVVLLFYEGEPQPAYAALSSARALVEASPAQAREWLSTIIWMQAIAGMRRGEDENCIECRGEGSCIFPIARAARHTNPAGSRLAIRHFTEYLQRHPDDPGARWLLNLAYMTLGEHPEAVPASYLIGLEHFRSEFDIGRFRDIAHLAGVNRMNLAGGAIMEDFDNDGLLDIFVSAWDPAMPVALYRNKGDGTFEDRTEAAGLSQQLGGYYCVQTDYNNDGHMDVFILRGAWLTTPMPPSLLRNNGDGTFTDVTREAGLMVPTNAISACWADYDNDGWLDLFIACEQGRNLLFRNKGDGTFEEVAVKAGVAGRGRGGKGASWGDFDGDGYPDLFVNYLDGPPALYRNNRDGTFTDVAAAMGVLRPSTAAFSCWFFDYDNDGWLDIYAAGYDRTLDEIVRGLLGQATGREVGRLYRNVQGKNFQDVTRAAGLEMVMAPMGSNFGDFDNDGYLDFYLGTGEPGLATLVPNRMFRNVAGQRFSEITTSAGTGHLQKGHGIAIGDWDRDGNVDIFMEVGGVTPGDRFRNVLFQNPGQGNHWLTVKLRGVKTNRAAIGARIKAVTAGPTAQTVYRHVNSGSSFGANPLQQTLGLARAERVAVLEVYWPTSGTTQVFRDVALDQAIEITEFAADYRKLDWQRIAVPR